MLRLMILLLLCIAATYKPGFCEAGASRDVEHARLPEFLSELDLSSLEASEEDVEALKKIVKRLASEKNVFFGNEDLLKEWLKGAGVTGQPGVDFPALTSIPATSFSCRGLRGGYYADLETNCQVFHICDNGRKISFLCPNGTIFQQSQLICDWWFKVDCSKSTELYEQSAEQLAEEEKKRADARKMKSEFHRTVQQGNTNYYGSDNANYDGKQNGRTNPYGQSPKQNQILEKQEEPKSVQHFGPNNVLDNARNSGRYFQENNANEFRGNERTNSASENFNQQPQQHRHYHEGGQNYQANSRQRNQLVDTQNGKFSHERENKFQDAHRDHHSTVNNAQDYYRPTQNTLRNEKPAFRNPKSRPLTRNNLFGSNQSQKSTPAYMETTTFRTTTAKPPREFQQFAESAAFVSNRNNRFNSKSDGSGKFYYHSYDHRGTTLDSRDRDTTTFVQGKNEDDGRLSFTPKPGAPPYPGPTFPPIYKPRTTTVPPYETTLQYTPTTETTPFYSTTFYRQDEIPDTTYSSTDIATTASPFAGSYQNTESFAAYNSQRTSPAIGSVPTNYQDRYADNRVSDRDTNRNTGSFATMRPYVNTESYRYNTANVTSTVSQDAFPYTTPYLENARDQSGAVYQNQNNGMNVNGSGTTKYPPRTSQNYQENSISTTEKPWRNANLYQPSTSTSRTLSPYDTSFTYQQGKVLSTLGPYIPFTKNYVYAAMTTTPKSTGDIASTLSPHNPTYANYRVTTNDPSPKMKSSSVTSRVKDRATYLPEVGAKRPTTLENRPYAEREHALSMLHSLQGLENNANSLNEVLKNGSSGRNLPLVSGPSTLHSLALYFATASDNFDFNETVDSAVSIEPRSKENPASRNESVHLPANILTQNTIASYAELFNLNNALDGNATVTELTSEADDLNEDDDLDIEQSEGPINGARKSNSTKLRELAQVFTHALSAYLEDPDTFKKVLTEIRPTEPPSTTTDGSQYEITTYPTTAQEYSSVTKEKDEVLDFSDDSDSARRYKPTTIIPTTLLPPTTTDRAYSIYHTTPYDEYYSTPISWTPRPVYYPSTTLLPPSIDHSSGDSGDYIESSTQVTGGNTFAVEVNRAFGTTATNDIRGHDSDTSDLSQVYDNYFPLDEDGNQSKIGGFHNNTARTFQPYGKNVKPFDSTPITNYMASSTPPFYEQSVETIGDKRIHKLTSSLYQNYGNSKSFEVSNSVVPSQTVRSTTPLPRKTHETVSSTVHPFRIHYYESTTLPEEQKTSPESLVTARSSYVKFRNSYNNIESSRKAAENLASTAPSPTQGVVGTLKPVTATINDVGITPYMSTLLHATSSNPTDAPYIKHQSLLNNDHWTSSPMVTQLWETTVFVDPQRINHGLESNYDVVKSSTADDYSEREGLEPTVAASTTRPPTTINSDGAMDTRTIYSTTTPSPWQWAPNDNSSPIAFTLLPTTYGAEKTATSTPMIATRSSLTTTMTSSISVNPLSQKDFSTLLPLDVTTNSLNSTEKEVIKAQEIFGNLNETSSNTLMRVMKQADNNETVRQLVLLLISHCNGPKNKTMEEEKEQLLDALLRMPVNEFTSEESREIVAGISRLNLPIGKTRFAVLSNSTTKIPRASLKPTSTEPSITTFRSRTGRKFRTTTESISSFARRSDGAVRRDTNNFLSEDKTTVSDSRALELLRSLYTVAAKWG